MLLGHIGASVLIQHYGRLSPAPVMLGGIFPDVLDKTLCQGLKLTSSGRMFAHTLLSWGLSSLLVYGLRGRRTALSWAAGYLGHLVCDIGSFVPWFYPFKRYPFKQSTTDLSGLLLSLLQNPKPLEILLLLWAGVVLVLKTVSPRPKRLLNF